MPQKGLEKRSGVPEVHPKSWTQPFVGNRAKNFKCFKEHTVF